MATVGGTATDCFVGASGARLATVTGSATGYTLYDLHGDIVGAFDAGGAISDAFRFDAYGQTLDTWPDAGSALNTAWRYQGRLDVSPTSEPLYVAGARLYAPSTGTFTQLDTVAGSAVNPMSMNRFLYAEANPSTFIDPSGHNACRYGREDCDQIAAYKSAYAKAAGRATRVPMALCGPGPAYAPGCRQYTQETAAEAGSAAEAALASKQDRGSGARWGRPWRGFAIEDDRPDCGLNPFCMVNNALGDAGDFVGSFVSDPLGTTFSAATAPGRFGGEVYANTIGNPIVNNGAHFLHDKLGVNFAATVGLCVQGGLSGGAGWGGSAAGGACFVATTNGQLGVVIYVSSDAGLGYAGSHHGIDVNLLLSNGEDVGDQRGPFGGAGGHVSVGPVGADVSATTGLNRCGKPAIVNLSVGWAPGAGIDVENHKGAGLAGSWTLWIPWQSKPSANC
jgi:RHS repeat-associated protein